MDYSWLTLLILAPIHISLAWVLVMPFWGSCLVTALAALEIGLGVALLVLDAKHKKAHDRYMEKLNEKIQD